MLPRRLEGVKGSGVRREGGWDGIDRFPEIQYLALPTSATTAIGQHLAG